MTIVIDTQKPPAPKVTGISPDTGKSSTDGVTTAHNLTISGTAQAGDLVGVLFNGIPVGVTMAGSNGAWTFDDTATTLPDGNYAIMAVVHGRRGEPQQFLGRIQRDDRDGRPAGHRRGQPDHRQAGPLAEPAVAVDHRHGPAQRPGPGLPRRERCSARPTPTARGPGATAYAPSSTTVPAGVYNFSAVAIDPWGNASAATPTFPLQVGGGPTAGTPQYASGVLSGQATPGSLVTIVDGDVVDRRRDGRRLGQLAVHADAGQGPATRSWWMPPTAPAIRASCRGRPTSTSE